MFAYLSKKVSIPNGVNLYTVGWENEQGWIASGGEQALLKVLRLGSTPSTMEKSKEGNQMKEESDNNSTGVTQTLEGHNGSVTMCAWNRRYLKLTSTDSNGLIIVWTLHKGLWYEEMVNNRGKSVVSSMSWNSDGEKICIAYADGAVIVGSVDGSRIWAKDLKHSLAHVCWSPDSNALLFGTKKGELLLYDASGNFITRVATLLQDEQTSVPVTSMDWYDGSNGYMDSNVPCLALAFETGKLQLCRSEKDTEPILIDSNMRSLKIKWNHNGYLLAVAGVQSVKASNGDERKICLVQFYTPYGQYLRYLKVPGTSISSLSWDFDGQRLSLAVDSYIYFANIRCDYRWCRVNDTLVYTYLRNAEKENTVSGNNESVVSFWNFKTGERNVKPISNLLFLASCTNSCLMITKIEGSSYQHTLHICDSSGTIMETNQVEFAPKFACLTDQYAVVAGSDLIMTWQYSFRQKNQKFTSDRILHIEQLGRVRTVEEPSVWADIRAIKSSTDPITCIDAVGSTLVIGRTSSTLIQLSMTQLEVDMKYNLALRPHLISLNCDASRLATIDFAGNFRMLILERHTNNAPSSAGLVTSNKDKWRMLEFEKKDVWNMKWAEDDPNLIAIMEKARLHVVRDCESEEPVTCNGYLSRFAQLHIDFAMMEEIVKYPETPQKEWVYQVETKSLKETRAMLKSSGLSDAYRFVERNPHTRLWRLIAETALGEFNFEIALKAFVRCMDYQGITITKNIMKLDDKGKQQAEIYTYFQQIELAEKTYLEMDRKDLAVKLRMSLGDWFRVVQLSKTGGADDTIIGKSWNAIGEYYMDRQKWAQAVSYFVQARNYEKLIDCYYYIEDYENLAKLVTAIPEKSPVLENIALKLASVGLCQESVAAFIKAGNIKSAVDTCIHLNQWNTAVELAEEYKLTGVEAMFANYGSYLLSNQKKFEAISLYRKANYCQYSAKLLYREALDAIKNGKPPTLVKKIFVLAALEVERYHQIRATGKHGNDMPALNIELISSENAENRSDRKFLDSPWRPAEAYHFYLLCQRQYHDGDFESAVKTARLLCEYEDIMESKMIYSLLALIAFRGKYYGSCSKAFTKLEALPTLDEVEREKFETLAFNIFTKVSPVDPPESQVVCTHCSQLISETSPACPYCQNAFPVCIVTGRPIIEFHHFTCYTCKHRAVQSEIAMLLCCPMCHTAI